MYAFAYHSDMSKYGPKAQLTAVTHQWGAYYTKVAQRRDRRQRGSPTTSGAASRKA